MSYDPRLSVRGRCPRVVVLKGTMLVNVDALDDGKGDACNSVRLEDPHANIYITRRTVTFAALSVPRLLRAYQSLPNLHQLLMADVVATTIYCKL